MRNISDLGREGGGRCNRDVRFSVEAADSRVSAMARPKRYPLPSTNSEQSMNRVCQELPCLYQRPWRAVHTQRLQGYADDEAVQDGLIGLNSRSLAKVQRICNAYEPFKCWICRSR